MVFKLHLMLLGGSILWLNSVNGQTRQQSEYYYYGQQSPSIDPSLYNQYNQYNQYNRFDPYQAYNPYGQYGNAYNPTPRQTVKIVTSDPRLLQMLQQMDVKQLQDIVNTKLLPYYEQYKIAPGTIFNVQVQKGEGRTVGGFHPPYLPSIRPPSIANIRPSTLINPGPYGINALKIGGVGILGPSLLGREDEYYEIGRPQTRSVDSESCTIDGTCSQDHVSSSSSVKTSSKIVDLHQIKARDNDKDQGRTNERLQNTDDQFTDQLLNAVQSEIIHLLRDMYKDGSNNIQNSNFSIDTAELRKILQKFTPSSRYFSGMEGSYRNQTYNPYRPVAPLPGNYVNNGWNSRNGDPNSLNYYSWWTNPYEYANNYGKTANTGYNYPSMNNEQLGNSNYYYPLKNNGQPGNLNYNYQPSYTSGQIGNPNYNYPAVLINGQPVNLNNNFSPMNNSGRPGNFNYNYPSMNNNGRPGNSNYNYPPMNNSGHSGNSTYNLQSMNNTGQPGNSPSTNSARPGFLYPNLQPFTNSGRPDSTNPQAQNNPNNGVNSASYNNYGNSLNVPSPTPGVYPINAGYQQGSKLNTGPQSQGQPTYNGNVGPRYEYQMPNYFQNSPQIYNPYEWYAKSTYS